MELTVRKNLNPPKIAILEKGFRPFFLLCALCGAIWIPLWAFRFSMGWSSDWIASHWHAHEMVYGFFIAMVAGFLLTAVENWTGRPVVNRWGLLGLVLLWIAGRIAYVGGSLSWERCVIENAFLPVLTICIARNIFLARSVRNYKIVAVLALFSILNITFSVAVLEVANQTFARSVAHASVYIVLLLVLIIGGRVFPFFTGRKVGLPTKNITWIEWALPISVLLLVASQFLPVFSDNYEVTVGIPSLISLVAGILVFLRMRHWQVRAALKVPMLAVLHLGHIFIGIGLILQALSYVLMIPNGESLSLHVIILGGLSLIGIGMITRVSLGHTGRDIVASRWMVLSFVCIALSALCRGILPIFFFSEYQRFIEIGSGLWLLGFLLYVVLFAPILFTARPDGRMG